MKYSSKFVSNTNYKLFWQPFIITYTITVLLVAAICVLQCNFPTDGPEAMQGYLYYRVNVGSVLAYGLAKSIEALVPTTITFVILLLLTCSDETGLIKTKAILGVVCIGVLGLLQPTMPNLVGFWIVLICIVLAIVASLYEIGKLVKCQGTTVSNRHKAEISDGNLCR